MKILAGEFEGRAVTTTGKLRPMTEMIKQALFHVLGDVDGLRVLELYCGSGQLGLECLSRGAAHVTFVDSDASRVKHLRGLLADWRVGAARAAVIKSESTVFLKKPGGPFGLILIDPPYEAGEVDRCHRQIESRPDILAPGGRYVARRSKHEPAEPPQGLESRFSRCYGDAVVDVFHKT